MKFDMLISVKGDLLNSAPRIKFKKFFNFLCLKGALCFLQKIAHNLNWVNCTYFLNIPKVIYQPTDEALNVEPERILERALLKSAIWIKLDKFLQILSAQKCSFISH